MILPGKSAISHLSFKLPSLFQHPQQTIVNFNHREEEEGFALLPLAEIGQIGISEDEDEDNNWNWRGAERAPKKGDKMKFGYVLFPVIVWLDECGSGRNGRMSGWVGNDGGLHS